MTYEERLKNVTVLGAGGKMGSGITLLTALEMASLSLKSDNPSTPFVLNAVDVSHQALTGLISYLMDQVQKSAEKNIVPLRKLYEKRAELVENRDVIEQYVLDVLKIVRPTTSLEPAYESTLIFEAIIEDLDLKVKLLSQIKTNNRKMPWFFSNTSSIPIHELDRKSGLDGNILGFHFYNPPAVQKLVELITAQSTLPELADFARTYAKNLRKTIVPANDYPGFIGNGFFMRDILYAISEIQRLGEKYPLVEAIYMVNKVSQDFLIRPMGIFQLIDYVGCDVCQLILKVMHSYLPGESLHSPLLDQVIGQGVRGGQNPDGSQKDGFLKYERNSPSGVYDPGQKEYVPISSFQAKCDEQLGPLPKSSLAWKSVVSHPKKDDILKVTFDELKSQETFGARLSRNYGIRTREIGLQLVTDQIARNENDVNTVMLSGFYHAYGPINDYFA